MKKFYAMAFALLTLLVFAAFASSADVKDMPPVGGNESAQAAEDDGAGAIEAYEALDEVNAIREASGLRPYERDPLLTRAAGQAAAFRSVHRIFGHTSNDFAFVPAGTHAKSAGCAANGPEHGFMACAMFDDYTHAGAAYVLGEDGRAYCHLYVRGGTGMTLGQRAAHFVRPLLGRQAQAANQVTKPAFKPTSPAAAPPTCTGPNCTVGVGVTLPAVSGDCGAGGCGPRQGVARLTLHVGEAQPVRRLAAFPVKVLQHLGGRLRGGCGCK